MPNKFIAGLLCHLFVFFLSGYLFLWETKLGAQTIVTHNAFLKDQDILKTEACFFPAVLIKSNVDDTIHKEKSLIYRKLFTEHLVQSSTEDYRLQIDPILLFSVGKDTQRQQILFENTRGFRAEGSLSNTIFFSSELYETQSILPEYQEVFADSFDIVASVMRAKEFKDYGKDYACAYGTVAWLPDSVFTMMFGRDKLHYGYGYRSMLLSDHAPGALFLRATVQRPVWSYNFILAALQNPSLGNVLQVPVSSLGGYQNKYANILTFTLRPISGIEISLFESMIWAPHSNAYNALHWKHFNPLPLSKTLWYGLADENNALTGLQCSFDLWPNTKLYMQYALDEIQPVRKTAFQAGIRFTQNFRGTSLNVLLELNSAGAYTYSHPNPLQSYSHYHHSLAHPFGANFTEGLLQTVLSHRHWTFFGLFSYTKGAVDTPYETNGQSLYSGYIPSQWKGSFMPLLTAHHSEIVFADVRLHYTLNTNNGLHVFAAYTFRKAVKTMFPSQSHIFQMGISTNLRFQDKNNTWL